MTMLDNHTADAVGAQVERGVRRPRTNRNPEQRVRAALKRVSRDKYLTAVEVATLCGRFLNCALRQYDGFGSFSFSRCMPRPCDVFGMLRGQPPCQPYDDGRGILLDRLDAICKRKNRGAAAEFEILRFQLRVGAYKWTRPN